MTQKRRRPARGERPGTGVAWIVPAVLLALLGAWSIYDLVGAASTPTGSRGLRIVLDVVQILVATAAATYIARQLATRRGRRSLPPLAGFPGRLLCYGAVASVAAPSLAVAGGLVDSADPVLHVIFRSGVVVGVAGAVLVLLGLPGRGRRPLSRWARNADLVVFNLVAMLLAVEGALVVMQQFFPSQILWDDSTAAKSILGLRRCEGNQQEPLFEYRCNSRGYPDEEFFVAGDDDYVVAVLADSFGAGSVPWEYNFATIAEQGLRQELGNRCARVAIHNFGVNGAGVPEYQYLIDTEVLDERPAQVVVALFVGNDLEGLEKPAEKSSVRRHVLLQRWLAPEVLRRLRRIAEGLERVSVPFDRGHEPAFLHDTSLEPPFFTDGQFINIERDRMEICVARSHPVERRFVWLFRALDAIHEQLGDRLLLMIIPDEFQVNDDLWDRLHEMVNRNPLYERERPQEKINAWCEGHGVRCLDLLPALREAERADRTYHLRDTHWNAHGNRVAAEAMVPELLAFARDPLRSPASCSSGHPTP